MYEKKKNLTVKKVMSLFINLKEECNKTKTAKIYIFNKTGNGIFYI